MYRRCALLRTEVAPRLMELLQLGLKVTPLLCHVFDCRLGDSLGWYGIWFGDCEDDDYIEE
jgi:hypothetical protein